MPMNGEGYSFDVAYTNNRWIVQWNDLQLEATGPRVEQSTIRCTVSVSRGGQLIYRDTVNLTSARVRARFTGALRAQDITLDEAALLALDEAIRMTPRNGRTPTQQGTISDPPPDFSGTVVTIQDLEALVYRWLRLKDRDLVRILLGAVAGHRAGGESPWLLLVGPPTSVKTELLRMLSLVRWVFRVSSLTARTFASGLDTPGGEPSLLDRLTDQVLVLKDFTTVLELPHEERQGVLAQLREIYDGHFDKYWGTGKELHWQGRLGLVAGVTPVIDQQQSVMGLLGPRFLLLRLSYSAAERPQVARRALRNAGRQPEMRRELAMTTGAFLTQLPRPASDLGPAMKHWLVAIADLVTHARSPVLRDGYHGTLQSAPAPEVPARLVLQLYALLQGLVQVGGGSCACPGTASRCCVARYCAC